MSSPLIPNTEVGSSCLDHHAIIMADIYQASINLCVWQRQLATRLIDYVDWLLKNTSKRELRIVAQSDEVLAVILKGLPAHTGLSALASDVNLLATMFTDLFDLKRVGIRLSLIDKTMCPRFHTDHLPCRLITTYAGSGTQWLPEYAVDRSKLGQGADGLPDANSGIYSHPNSIEQLTAGDVGLLKGSGWLGNEQHAIVHRSPEIAVGEKRLLLTLDFAH
ncbi:MAG: hypothetical protein ACI9QV_000079 [Methylophagaceae bacterium]|jgi:hypothetical protein